MSNWGTRLAAISCVLLVEIGGTSLLGQPASAPKPPMFAFPSHVAATPDGHVYVTDSLRNRVHWLRDADLDLLGGWGYAGSADGQFNRPMGIAVDGNGSVFVVDTSNARIQKFDVAGSVFKAKWGSLGSTGAGSFRRPVAVAVDGNVLQGNVYVLDADTFIIHKLSNDLGSYLGSLGGARGTGDGEFSSIRGDLAGLAVDPAGNLYISDPGNHRIQKWTISSDAKGNITFATFSGWLGACTGGANCDTASQRSRGFSCTAATCTATPARSGTLANSPVRPAWLSITLAISTSPTTAMPGFRRSTAAVVRWVYGEAAEVVLTNSTLQWASHSLVVPVAVPFTLRMFSTRES
jgi:DNA-binding beta-propeller fold protein YncE